MAKRVSSKKLYLVLLDLALIIFLILSIILPFLVSNGYKLHLLHLFNPTNVPFTGETENLYGYVIVTITFLTIPVNLLPPKIFHETHLYTYLSIKISCFLLYVCATMTYFRVIFPNSFLVGFNTSDVLPGLYIFIVFLLFYFITFLIDCFEISNILPVQREAIDLNNKLSRDDAFYKTSIRIATILLSFTFISLFFVPFYINYTSYMKEAGFETYLDNRTSVNYYFLSMFDKTFSITLPSIILIIIVCYCPVLVFVKKGNKYNYFLLVLMIFYFILMTLCLAFGLMNETTITPLLKLELNPYSLIFIILNLASALSIIIYEILSLRLQRKAQIEVGVKDEL